MIRSYIPIHCIFAPCSVLGFEAFWLRCFRLIIHGMLVREDGVVFPVIWIEYHTKCFYALFSFSNIVYKTSDGI